MKASPFRFSSRDFPFNFANISDYTHDFAVNKVVYGFFYLNTSVANKSQNYHADWKIFTYAQKSSTVSNFEIRRRFACQVLLLSFLKNQSAHLKKNKIKNIYKLKYIKNAIIVKLIASLNILWAERSVFINKLHDQFFKNQQCLHFHYKNHGRFYQSIGKYFK